MIKAVIFDLDGVLVDARDWHYVALNRALSLFGYSINRQEHLSLYNGLPTAVKLEFLSQRKNLPKLLHPFIHELKQKFTRQTILSSCKPEIKTSAMLRHLKAQGYQLAVASNAVRTTVDLALEKMAIRAYFDVTFSNEDVEKAKPHPEIYNQCMKSLGVSPDECLIVEDSIPGIQSARSSGANLLIVTGTEEVMLDRVLNQIHRINTQQKKNSFPQMTIQKSKPSHQLEIIVPMAGLGQRFSAAGYKNPKPFIDVLGKPMIQWVVENITPIKTKAHFTFICNEQHLADTEMSRLLQKIAPGCSIVQLPSVTEGAACSVLLAIEHIDPQSPLLLVNSDQWIECNIDEFLSKAHNEELDGLIMTFQATEKKWSYAKINSHLKVTQVAEKFPISSHATVGIYYFKHSVDFFHGAMEMIRKDIRTNGEFYVCPVYNELILKQKDIRIFEIERSAMHGLGTPEDLELFLRYIPGANPSPSSQIKLTGKSNLLKTKETATC